jgi:hypothetical protein
MRTRIRSGPGNELRAVVRAGVGSVFALEIEGGVYEGDVGEGLGKIADQALAIDVIFLGEQAEVVRE